jgi:hypothetical protein
LSAPGGPGAALGFQESVTECVFKGEPVTRPAVRVRRIFELEAHGLFSSPSSDVSGGSGNGPSDSI